MKSKFQFAVGLALFGAMALLLSGASTKQSAAVSTANPAWPPAPDEPRVVYLRSLRSPVDVGQSR
jgi:hypothetical protein